jgi:hypothetical protein
VACSCDPAFRGEAAAGSGGLRWPRPPTTSKPGVAGSSPAGRTKSRCDSVSPRQSSARGLLGAPKHRRCAGGPIVPQCHCLPAEASTGRRQVSRLSVWAGGPFRRSPKCSLDQHGIAGCCMTSVHSWVLRPPALWASGSMAPHAAVAAHSQVRRQRSADALGGLARTHFAAHRP